MYYFLDLDEQTPVPCGVDEWLIFENAPSHLIAEEFIKGMKITTRFCGVDPSYQEERSHPFLYETTITGGLYHGEELKYESRENAMEGHMLVCQVVACLCL